MLIITPGMYLLGGFGIWEKIFFFKQICFLKSPWHREVDRAKRGDFVRAPLEVKELDPTNPSSGWLGALRVRTQLPWEANPVGSRALLLTKSHSRGATEPVARGGEGETEETPTRASPRTGQWQMSASEIQMAHRRKKRYLASPETQEMHTQATMEYCFSPIRLAKIKTKWYLVLASAGSLTWGGGRAGPLLQGDTCFPTAIPFHS